MRIGKTSSVNLKKRLLRAVMPILVFGILLIIGVDCFAVVHIREHAKESSLTIQQQLLEVLPLLILPHVVLLLLIFAVIYKIVDREVLFPLLALTTRFMNLSEGIPQPIKIENKYSNEIEDLYLSYNLCAEELNRSRRNVCEIQDEREFSQSEENSLSSASPD